MRACRFQRAHARHKAIECCYTLETRKCVAENTPRLQRDSLGRPKGRNARTRADGTEKHNAREVEVAR